jgi:guanine deaminase
MVLDHRARRRMIGRQVFHRAQRMAVQGGQELQAGVDGVPAHRIVVRPACPASPCRHRSRPRCSPPWCRCARRVRAARRARWSSAAGPRPRRRPLGGQSGSDAGSRTGSMQVQSPKGSTPGATAESAHAFPHPPGATEARPGHDPTSRLAIRATCSTWSPHPRSAMPRPTAVRPCAFRPTTGCWSRAAASSAARPPTPATAGSACDHRGRLLLPGFIDSHVHMPQLEVIASHGADLLDWLQTYTFPAERRYADPEVSRLGAETFADALLAHGTTAALVFPTVHAVSADAMAAAAAARGMRCITGKVLMDRHAPDGLRDTDLAAPKPNCAPASSAGTAASASAYALTVRFAPCSTPAQLALAGRLLAEMPDLYHADPSGREPGEVRWVAELFPEARSYLDVYHRAGLLGPRSVLAHGIWLDDADRALLAADRRTIAHCPTSNLFLGSGLMNWPALAAAGAAVLLASDVGGGTSLSMLRTMAAAYQVQALRAASPAPGRCCMRPHAVRRRRCAWTTRSARCPRAAWPMSASGTGRSAASVPGATRRAQPARTGLRLADPGRRAPSGADLRRRRQPLSACNHNAAPVSSMTLRLELRGMRKQYPGVVANDDVDLRVAPGEIHAVLGENGAGKSTLMKIIYGAVQPDAGEMRWNGHGGAGGQPGAGAPARHQHGLPALQPVRHPDRGAERLARLDRAQLAGRGRAAHRRRGRHLRPGRRPAAPGAHAVGRRAPAGRDRALRCSPARSC